MNPLVWIRLGGIAAVLAILIGLYWYVDSRGYDRAKKEYETATNEAIIKQQQETQAITLAYARKLTEGMVQYEKDQATIADARARINKLQVNFPSCPVSSTTGQSSNTDEASRMVSERVDALFGVLQSRVTGIIEQCEQINSQAILVNSLKY